MANDDIQSLLNEAIESKQQFDNFLSSSTTAINQILEKARSDLGEVDRLKTQVASIKGGAEAIQSALNADQVTLSQSKAEIETLRSSSVALSSTLSQEHADITAKLSGLQSQQSALQDVLTAVTELKARTESDSGAARTLVSELEQVRTRFTQLNSETGAQYDALKQRQDSLQEKITRIEEADSEISGLRAILLTTSGEKLSTKDQIEKLRAEIDAVLQGVTQDRNASVSRLSDLTEQFTRRADDFREEQEAAFGELHSALKAQILSLLPSAGAAGLAYTFYDAKSRYSPTSFAKRPGSLEGAGWKYRMRGLLGYNPASIVAMVFFYGLFLLPLGIIAIGSFQLLWKLESDPHFTLTYPMLLLRFLIVLPLGTLSGFGFASLQLYRRLFEEYNHKQRVMELYQSFNDEIEKAGDEDKKRALLGIMLDTVSDKAWRVSQEKAKEQGAEDAFSVLEKFSAVVAKIKAS